MGIYPTNQVNLQNGTRSRMQNVEYRHNNFIFDQDEFFKTKQLALTTQ